MRKPRKRCKQEEAYRDTLRELRQAKVGGMARLKGVVENIELTKQQAFAGLAR